jgi:glycosyltransferase involved in cell wall biosynthesis
LKILFLVTEDWYFVSHRLRLAQAARSAGAEVVVMTHVTGHGHELDYHGFKVIPWRISRRSLNPFREVSTFMQVLRAYRQERPDLVHHVALKPVVYGGLASHLSGRMPNVNAIAGMGHVFTSNDSGMRFLRRPLLVLLRSAIAGKRNKIVLQNDEDRRFLVKNRIVRIENTAVIRGSGVNVNEFVPEPEPAGVPIVLLASRMIWEKGIGDFVKAAQLLRAQKVRVRFVLVGKPDPENPGSISEAQLREWTEGGVVEWWGHQHNMPKVLSQANVVCLPSAYGEGVPRILIEAAASGRAIVATDAPGCRDVVCHGHNGFLVPVHDPQALANSIGQLVANPSQRTRMGARSRDLAVYGFSEEVIISETLALYEELTGLHWAEDLAGREKQADLSEASGHD